MNTKTDLARKPKEEDIDEERELEAMKKCRVCAKNEVEGHKDLDSHKMQPDRGLSWIVDRVFFITSELTKDRAPKTAGNSCSTQN